MIQKHRISTNIGQDKKILVELNQNFDLLEILSLKFSQKDIYASVCSDYGVVCGRITVNDGFGIPNAKVSIFIPLSDEDSEDPVISELYPYKKVDDKSEDGYRYNLLPKRKQHGGHEPTGTFPDQIDIMTREEVLEVYEKYYKYTVKTNDAGDFMIWGVPIGEQKLHVDVDLSDIGCFSLRPYDYIRQGSGVDNFKNSYEFKSSTDIDSLPQIVKFDKDIIVYPFWGNEDLCEIGITRTDFDLSETGVKIEPKAFIIGGTFTDAGNKNTINKNCGVRKKMGRKCDLTTKKGNIEAIRFTTERDSDNRPILELYQIEEDVSDDGGFVFPVPMNMEYVYTNEYGEREVTNDTNKGIPTSACYRFRFSLEDGNLTRVRQTGYYLVPNIREYQTQIDRSYEFSTNWKSYPTLAVSTDSDKGILYNVQGSYYPRDYFYRVTYNKVYTISSYHDGFFDGTTYRDDRFVGIKELLPAEEEDCSDEIVTPPINFGFRNKTFTLLIADLKLSLEHFLNLIVLTLANTLVRVLMGVGDIMTGLNGVRKAGRQLIIATYGIQESAQRNLRLVNYPECEECSFSLLTGDENEFGTPPPTGGTSNYCKVGQLDLSGSSTNSPVTSYYNNVPERTNITITHNLGVSPTFQVFLYNSSTGQYDSLVDYNFTFDPGTNNTFWVENRTDLNEFNLYLTYTGNSSGYVVVSAPASSVFTVSNVTFDNPVASCAYNASPRQITSNSDFVSNQSSYLLINTADNHTIAIGSDASFILDPSSNLSYVDNSNSNYTGGTYLIVDRITNSTGSTTSVEEGCDIYDTPYDEDLITYYYTGTTKTIVYPTSYQFGMDIQGTNLSNRKNVITSFDSGLNGACGSRLCPVYFSFDQDNNNRIYPLQTWWEGESYERQTHDGWSQFMNGVFTIVPGAQTNKRLWDILKEYRRRKRVGTLFCGGIVNYSFVYNWLSGSLYFPQFKAKKGKSCINVTRYVSSQNKYYYKSAIYYNETSWGNLKGGGSSRVLGRPTTLVDLGPRDEFIKEICIDKSLDPNCSVVRSIGPSSFQSFGELLGLAINYRMDVSNNTFSVKDFFNNGGFTFTNNILDGDLLQLISMNNEAGMEEFDLQNPKYLGYSYQVLDPDNPNLSHIFKAGTSVYGPLPITLYFDIDGERVRACLNEGTHIDYSGNIVQGRLTESSQKIPFFLWDKKGEKFGPYNTTTLDNQSWDFSNNGLQVQPLQGMKYGYTYTGGTNDSSDQYLLLPMTYNFSGITLTSGFNTGFDFEFDEISTASDRSSFDREYPGFTFLHVTSGTVDNPISGTMYTRVGPVGHTTSSPYTITNGWASLAWDNTKDFIIRPTLDYYSGSNKQILSTPFMFYFGLRNGKTGVDKFIQLFGDIGAFTSAE
jgi:hypothetical protein